MQNPLISDVSSQPTKVLELLPWSGSTAFDVDSSESHLSKFVEWSLRQSLSPQFTTSARMKILERAWNVQKRVWEIRIARHTSLIQNAQWN